MVYASLKRSHRKHLLQQPATSSTNNTSDSNDSSSTGNSTSSDETDDHIETEVVTMEELIYAQVDIV